MMSGVMADIVTIERESRNVSVDDRPAGRMAPTDAHCASLDSAMSIAAARTATTIHLGLRIADCGLIMQASRHMNRRAVILSSAYRGTIVALDQAQGDLS